MIMVDVLITTDLDKLSQSLEQIKGQLPNMLSDVVHEVGTLAFYISQTNCPVKTGNLKQRAGCDNSMQGRSVIWYAAPYAQAVEYGTGIYGPKGTPITIVPRLRKALHWVDGFGEHFAKKVVVKGMPPRPFLRGAVAQAQTQVQAIAKAVFDKYAAGAVTK